MKKLHISESIIDYNSYKTSGSNKGNKTLVTRKTISPESTKKTKHKHTGKRQK